MESSVLRISALMSPKWNAGAVSAESSPEHPGAPDQRIQKTPGLRNERKLRNRMTFLPSENKSSSLSIFVFRKSTPRFPSEEFCVASSVCGCLDRDFQNKYSTTPQHAWMRHFPPISTSGKVSFGRKFLRKKNRENSRRVSHFLRK